MLYKLLQYTNNGNLYKILKSMYSNDKLCAKIEDKMTEFFTNEVGVRQGGCTEPTLFKIFINDLPGILSNTPDCVYLDNEKISCLLYSVDLVLMSNSRDGLQKKVDILYTYCNDWCMEVNVKKNKDHDM